jgi:hypothetical protein
LKGEMQMKCERASIEDHSKARFELLLIQLPKMNAFTHLIMCLPMSNQTDILVFNQVSDTSVRPVLLRTQENGSPKVEGTLNSYDALNYYGELGKLNVANKCFQKFKRYFAFTDSRF